MKKRAISFFCALALLFGSFAWMFPARAAAADDENSVLISESEIPLRLWYDEEAPVTDTENNPKADGTNGGDDGWEQWSLPIGNGYFGANIFGRTESERIQLTDKTMANPQYVYDSDGNKVLVGGLNNFSETYIDFGHTNSEVEDYKRYLDLKTAIAGVEYTYDGVKYTREHFTSYPDKALVIKLSADTEGKLDFTLRPTVPFEQSYAAFEGDELKKEGTVTSFVENGVGCIELSGNLNYWGVDFYGLYKVYINGGSQTADLVDHSYTDSDETLCTDQDGVIKVSGATDAYIVVTFGTDYVLSSETFTASSKNKPTQTTTLEDAINTVEPVMDAIDEKFSSSNDIGEAYSLLKTTHINDYNELFGRVTVDLGIDSADFDIPTDTLLENYKESNSGNYLETLFLQYGRYLLIASSRSGSMPSNLQGTWNAYNMPPWASGYWHNINVQMNYWHAFSTNIAETFEAYIAFNDAYMEKAQANASSIINQYYASLYDMDGGNGWCIGTGANPFGINMDRSAGNLGFTTQLYWEYYAYTLDEKVLEKTYDILTDAARFITKIVSEDEDGNYLVDYCDSPEVHVNGVWYYTTGTTYAQTFAYLNNYNALAAAKALGIDITDTELLSSEEYSILATVLEQIDKYDPIHVGLSGQIKEFREEDYYGSIGDDPNHRHVSQLVGLYPGNLINGTTPAWLDAAKVTLENRGGNTTGGWVYAHKTGLYARTKDGENAHARIEELFTRSMFPNLFTKLWEVYQIDASFGTTAGMTEMLLQSHAGYIEPLAAMPSEWSNGSYTGLVARGNYEVSAAWENGVAKTFNILSNKGGEVSVYYPTITTSKVVTSSGMTVDYTVSGTNLISFDTTEGETYIISGFSAVNAPDAPESLDYTRVDFGNFNLAWAPVADAVTYNVYVAVENAPNYTLITSTDKPYAKYTPADYEENSRTTFAVTSVNANGEESDRTLCYYNPVDTSAYINGVQSCVNDDGGLQITVDATENAAKYRLYEKTSDSESFSVIYESGFPLLYSSVYNAASEYAVSVISYFDGEESELYLVKSFAGSGTDFNASNIFEDKVFVQETGDAYNSLTGYEYSKLTDGIIDTSDSKNGRYSSIKYNDACATIDLQGTYILSEIRFYIFNKQTIQAGENFKLEVYSNGKWIEIVSGLSNATLVSDYIITQGTGRDSKILTFDLGCIRGSKIRFYTESDATNGYITFYEAQCTGLLLEGKYATSENILVDKEFIGTEPTTYSENAGGDVFTYDKLTDGVISSVWNIGRFSSTKNGKANGTVDLGGIYNLYEIKFYDFSQNYINAGQNFKIDLYYDGEWTNAVSVESNDDFAEYRVSVGEGYTENWLGFNLNGALAEKIRFTADAVSDNSITFYEIECSGALVCEYGEYNENLLLGKEVTPDEAATKNSDQYDYVCLTDGSFNKSTGRFSSKYKGLAGATIDLDGEYALSELRFYEFISGKNTSYPVYNFTVEILSKGKWITLASRVDENSEYTSINNVSFNDLDVFKSEVTVNNQACYEFKFPINNVTAEKIRFSGISDYYVTFHEIECSGYKIPVDVNENVSSNSLECAVGSVSSTILSGTVDNITDGNLDTVLSVSGNTYSLEFDFETVKRLYSLKIYELAEAANLVNGVLSTASDDTTVEIYRNSAWIKVIDNLSLNDGGLYTELNLYGIESSKLRITFTNTRLFDDESTYRSAKISEISCTAGYDIIDLSGMITALEKLPNADLEQDINNRYLYNETYKKFKTYASDTKATQAEIELYTAEIENYCNTITSAMLSAYNISLGGDISLNFRYKVVDADILASYPNAYVEFLVPSPSGVKTTKVYLKDAPIDSEGRYIFSVEVAAAQLTNEITLYMVYDENTVGASFTTSVREYADYVLANSETMEAGYPGVCELLRSMLNYGAYAQSYFGYNTENLANDGIYTDATDPVLSGTLDESASVSVTGGAEGIKCSGWKISLLSKTTLKVYFALTDAAISDYEITVISPSGEETEITAVADGARYRVDIADIGASELDNDYTIKIKRIADGSEYSVSISVMCYVSAMKTSADTNMVNLVHALKLYSDAANAYFERN